MTCTKTWARCESCDAITNVCDCTCGQVGACQCTCCNGKCKGAVCTECGEQIDLSIKINIGSGEDYSE